MPGFYTTNCKPVKMERHSSFNCVEEGFQTDDFTFHRITRDQFMDDKLFFENDEYAVVLESVIFNKTELMERYGMLSFKDTVLEMISENFETFFAKFKGMFSGAVYDRKAGKMLAFADQIGNRAVFYYADGESLIIGSQLDSVTDTMKENDIPCLPNEDAMRFFLAYGSWMDERTGVKNVYRILPGDCLLWEAGTWKINTYHSFREDENLNLTTDEAIDLLDSSFKKAVKNAIDKNAEYGYTGILDISGGADSRMIAYAANELGCENIIGCHYSQSGSYEEKASEAVAKRLGIPLVIQHLDDAQFLKEADVITRMNSGTAYYCGITGGKRLLESLREYNPGIEFTGLLGNVLDGGMVTEYGDEIPSLEHGQFVVCPTVDRTGMELDLPLLSRFKTNDMFWLYTRGMLCGMSTFLTRQNYVEPYTPYGDTEFIQAWLSIPWKKKVREKILLRWMQRVYPDSMNIMYASLGYPLKRELSPFWTSPPVRRATALKNRLGWKLGLFRKIDMNPFYKWEKEKEWLQTWLEQYYTSSIEKLSSQSAVSEQFLEELEKVYKNDTSTVAKYLVITLLSYIQLYILP